MTKGEEDFVSEYARKLLVELANLSIQGKDLSTVDVPQVYLDYAIQSGWLGKSLPLKLTAKGYSSAASFLRR